ncbi:MAG: hypothetical protein WKF77_03175 [Planctomycetaceae bacterium]
MTLTTSMTTDTSTKIDTITRKTQLELALLLPEIPDRRDACVQRLIDLLKAKDGVTEAHVTDPGGKPAGRLCVHFDADRISIAEVRDLAQRAGMARRIDTSCRIQCAPTAEFSRQVGSISSWRKAVVAEDRSRGAFWQCWIHASIERRSSMGHPRWSWAQ